MEFDVAREGRAVDPWHSSATKSGSGEVVGGRYIIEDLLARGGMADVYRGRDVLSNRPVAIKALRIGAADADRFQVETGLLARLDHPNLVRLLDTGQLGQAPFLVMDLVDGPTLADRLEHGPLSAAEASRIGGDIARALAHVHAREVIHRDVKPSNILLAPDGRALLADFGVARLTDGDRVTGAQATIGTAAFLAPEQIGGIGVTPAADVYALGLVLIEALSGQPAFIGTQDELLAARVAGDPRIPARLPAPWPGLLRAMTRRSPGVRPRAAEVADRLAAPVTADPGLDTAEADMVTVMDHSAEAPAETEMTEIMSATGAAVAPPGDMPAAASAAQRLMPWLLGALIALALTAAIAVAPRGSPEDSDTPAAEERAALQPGTSTTVSTTSTSSTTTSTTTSTTVPAIESSRSPAGADASPPAGCAEIEARRQAIEAEKQQVEELYRDDPRTREQLKQQLQDEKRALDSQERALGC